MVPVAERPDDLKELYGSFSREVSKFTERYEFIFVIDDGFEQAYEAAKSLRAADPEYASFACKDSRGVDRS